MNRDDWTDCALIACGCLLMGALAFGGLVIFYYLSGGYVP